MSRHNTIWAINLSTGDKFSDKRWTDYYPIELEENPAFGHFEEGSVIGMLLDADRGRINFFKDGEDLGDAFVSPELKKGKFYPFV